MNLISVDTYAKLLIDYARTCILNMYMYLKLFKQKINLRQCGRGQDIEPYHAKFYLVLVVCREGGLYWCVFFNIILFFSKSELKTQIRLLPKKQNLENIFIDNISNTNLFQVAC